MDATHPTQQRTLPAYRSNAEHEQFTDRESGVSQLSRYVIGLIRRNIWLIAIIVAVAIIAAVVLSIALVALIAYSTMGLSKARVEVCMEFEGRQSCSTTSAETKDQAVRTAIQTACATISSGVTQVMGCQNTNPSRITWLK